MLRIWETLADILGRGWTWNIVPCTYKVHYWFVYYCTVQSFCLCYSFWYQSRNRMVGQWKLQDTQKLSKTIQSTINEWLKHNQTCNPPDIWYSWWVNAGLRLYYKSMSNPVSICPIFGLCAYYVCLAVFTKDWVLTLQGFPKFFSRFSKVLVRIF